MLVGYVYEIPLGLIGGENGISCVICYMPISGIFDKSLFLRSLQNIALTMVKNEISCQKSDIASVNV